MTATEASRRFAALLDAVERGETVIVTRGGQRIASVAPATSGNGRAVMELLSQRRLDPDFAADVRAVRELVTDEITTWPDD